MALFYLLDNACQLAARTAGSPIVAETGTALPVIFGSLRQHCHAVAHVLAGLLGPELLAAPKAARVLEGWKSRGIFADATVQAALVQGTTAAQAFRAAREAPVAQAFRAAREAPVAPPSAVLFRVRALYDAPANNANELSMQHGDILAVLQEVNADW